MSIELWLAFAAASTALLAIPGPTVMLVVGYVINRGKATGWATVPAVILGDFSAMSVSLLGAGAILNASASLFMALKLAGAAYLIWIGVKMWRTTPILDNLDNMTTAKSNSKIFWNTYIVTALNPKGIVFFIAFMPQFITQNMAALPQFSILIVTFLTLAALNIILWVMMAGHLRTRFKQPSTLKIVNNIGGSFLIAAGLFTGIMRRVN